MLESFLFFLKGNMLELNISYIWNIVSVTKAIYKLTHTDTSTILPHARLMTNVGESVIKDHVWRSSI